MMMNKIKIAIAGGTGYTAGELIRILINHPNAEIVSVLSTTSAGEKITSFHRDLYGECDLLFSSEIPDNIDLIFLCLGHGLSREFIEKNNIPAKCKIIDLGNDFRVENSYHERKFVYGLPEINEKAITGAQNVANPGCFATAIQLALLPLIEHKLISDEIHIHAITGSTGAGRKLSPTTHFSDRESNISVYKPFTHQHLSEIHKTFSSLGFDKAINFVPVRGDFTKGIFASLYTKIDTDQSYLNTLYNEYYRDAPFVFLSEENLSLKEVVNTNKCLINTGLYNGYVHITSIIDNLIKGASGQAVQNMNLMFGFDQTTGLKLKGSGF